MLVVIALSGRALAQSAAKTRERIVVLDAFGDRDTREVAEVTCVAAAGVAAIDAERLLAALAADADTNTQLDLLIGSGFEHAPELLARVASYGRLYANDAGIVAALKDPELGTELLRATGWSVPLTQRAPPPDSRGWLQKEIGGAGGIHIRRAPHTSAGPRVYFQRELPGQPLSVTFLADGERAHVLGFNRLRIEAVGEAAFCYAGAVAGIELAPSLRTRAQLNLDRLVHVTGLRGLAGLDFILDGAEMMALEVNARPTATFELYDRDFAEGLVHWHMLSFERPVPEFGKRLVRRRKASWGLGVIYARHPLRVPLNAAFPPWCRDLPGGGNAIPIGAPVFSVFAQGANADAAERALEARSRTAREMLARWAIADLRAVA